MTFDEFLAGRLADLVRFATVLTGRRVLAEQLVVDAITHVHTYRADLGDGDLAYAELRVWIVRGYLSEGMRLGSAPAADIDAPIVAASEATGDWDDLTARFVTSSKLQRAMAALRYHEDLDIADTAAVMGSTSDGIALYLQRVLGDLNVRADDGSGADTPDAHSETDIRDLLQLYGEDVDSDVSGVVDVVRTRVPAAPAPVAPSQDGRAFVGDALAETVSGGEADVAAPFTGEQREAELLERYQREREDVARKQSEAQRREAARREVERLEQQRARRERADTERREAERIEQDRLAAERREVLRVEAARVEAERLEDERLEAERLEAERLEAERLEAERLEAERVEAERLEAERLEAERLEAERLEAERLEAERLEAERVEAERVEAERLEAERVEAERTLGG